MNENLSSGDNRDALADATPMTFADGSWIVGWSPLWPTWLEEHDRQTREAALRDAATDWTLGKGFVNEGFAGWLRARAGQENQNDC